MKIKFEKDKKLSAFTTFRLGAQSLGVTTSETESKLVSTVKELCKNNFPFIVIGAGSNLLASDKNIDCYVVRFISPSPLISVKNNRIIVSGATLLDDLAKIACERGLAGLNFAGGIPGTVAGAIVGNAGAYGQAMSDSLESVVILDSKGTKREIKKKYLKFGYRESIFKSNNWVVLSVKIVLKPGNKKELKKERDYILLERSLKHPDWKKIPTAGSFFKNIEPTSKAGIRQSAGWFLDKAGCKKFKVGGARVFEKHANIIISHGKTKAEDVLALSDMMKKAVKDKFNIDLVREVRLLGEFEGYRAKSNNLFW